MDRRKLLIGGTALAAAAGAAGFGRTAKAATTSRNSPSIFDFGAVGDGVTDDSAAFTAALKSAAANGQMIAVPAATYAIAQPITFTSTADVGAPWGLSCQGATLVSKITTGEDVMYLVSNNTVRYFNILGGLKITGNGAEGNGLHIAALGSSVYFYNVSLQNLYIEAVGGNGLFLEGDVFESMIIDCFFQDCKQNGAMFANSKGGICSAITVVGCIFAQNGQYGLCATDMDNQYGGTMDVRVFGGYCRDNQSYGFYYNNGTDGAAIQSVGFENNCRSLQPGDPNGAHIYGLVSMKLRDCNGYNMVGGATYLLRGWFNGLTMLDGCNQSAGGAMAQTGASRLVQVNGNSSGMVLMRGCTGGVAVASGNSCPWVAEHCSGPCPTGTLSLATTTTS